MLGFHLSPLALCCRFQCGCSVFNSMNVAAVFAPEKVEGCAGSVALNCVPERQFAATTRTRLLVDMGRLHGVLLCPRQRYTATMHSAAQDDFVTISLRGNQAHFPT